MYMLAHLRIASLVLLYCLVSNWDDHEHSNNAYGYGLEENSGAENHQPICSVPRNATGAQKNGAECDRDEGIATGRFTCSGMSFSYPVCRSLGIFP